MKKEIVVNNDPKRIDEILNRGVIANILPDKISFREKLLSGKQLKIYIGVDATSTALHLSHAKNYILLEEFRKLGHQTILLFGDFTARIGDPTDKMNTRSKLSVEDVKENVSAWIEQIKPIVDFKDKTNPPCVVYNNDWLSKLSFEEVIDIASNFTVQHMIERDMFEKRLNEGKPIYLHEFFYPLMQGYDSVALDVDVELCGTDQTFNALAGRTLLKKFKDKEKHVVAVNLMENPITKELMSKSKGTGVFLGGDSNEMYGQIMSQKDEMTEVLYVNITRLPLGGLDKLKKMDNPRDFKMIVAKEIVKIFYGDDSANKAEENFLNTFSKGGVPENIEEIKIEGKKLIELIVPAIIPSKNEFKRLIENGAVRDVETKEKINDPEKVFNDDVVLKIGKKIFVKLVK